MSKSQLNRLSKRQIFENLYERQMQDSAVNGRLFTALTKVLNISPEALAAAYVDDEYNAKFAQEFNLKLSEARANQHTHSEAETSSSEPAPESVSEEPTQN
jgi:hypothetical protein